MESDTIPIFCAMTASDQNQFFHIHTQPELIDEGKPGVDVRSHPFAEVSAKASVLTSRR